MSCFVVVVVVKLGKQRFGPELGCGWIVAKQKTPIKGKECLVHKEWRGDQVRPFLIYLFLFKQKKDKFT